MEKLQKRIRKLKNPSMVCFCPDPEQVPQSYMERCKAPIQGYCAYAKDLLLSLKEIVSAVRFGFGDFALLGQEGLDVLAELLNFACDQEYYVLLDAPEMWSPRQAELAANRLMCRESLWNFDGLLLSCYAGSDVLKPFTEKIKTAGKDIFVAVRTANKSASEIQDLLTGSRLVYTAAADIVKRLGEGVLEHSGYSRVGIVGPATSSDALAAMRNKYPGTFILVDGFDYSGANAKICANAFDKLGHGAVACAGNYITQAWKDTDLFDPDPVELAVAAAERMKKNLSRYVTIL